MPNQPELQHEDAPAPGVVTVWIEPPRARTLMCQVPAQAPGVPIPFTLVESLPPCVPRRLAFPYVVIVDYHGQMCDVFVTADMPTLDMPLAEFPMTARREPLKERVVGDSHFDHSGRMCLSARTQIALRDRTITPAQAVWNTSFRVYNEDFVAEWEALTKASPAKAAALAIRHWRVVSLFVNPPSSITPKVQPVVNLSSLATEYYVPDRHVPLTLRLRLKWCEARLDRELALGSNTYESNK